MTENKMKIHAFKEAIKKFIEDSPNYSAQMKVDLKTIVDLGNTPEEIFKAWIVYCSMCK